MSMDIILKDHKPLIQMKMSYDKLRKGEFYTVSKLCRWDIRICQLNGEYACDPSECYIVKKNIVPVLGVPDSPKPFEDSAKLIGKRFKTMDTDVIYKIVSDTDDPRLMMMIDENASSLNSPEIVTKYWLSKFAVDLDKSTAPPEWIEEGTLLFRPATKNCSASVSYISSIWWEGLDDDNEPRLHLKDPKTGSFYNPMLSEVLEYCYPIGIFKDFYGNDHMDDDEYDTED